MSDKGKKVRLTDRIKEYYLGVNGVKWSLHNLIGHPVSEILYLLGMPGWSEWVRVNTLPSSRKGRG